MKAIAMRAGGGEWLVEAGYGDPTFARLSTGTTYPVQSVRGLTGRRLMSPICLRRPWRCS